MRRHLQSSLNIVAVLCVFIALVIPDRIAWIDTQSFAVYPLELLVLGFVLLVPGRAGSLLRVLAAFVLAVGTVLKFADMTTYEIFARPFNPVFDAYLLADGMNLLTGAIGRLGAVLVAMLLAGLAAGVVLLAYVLLGRVQGLLLSSPRRSATLLGAGLLIWCGLALAGWGRTSTYFSDLLAIHVRNTFAAIAELEAFREIVDVDAYAEASGSELFAGLAGKDVLVIFVESYGRAVLDDPEFAAHVVPVLEAGSATLAEAGLHVRSGFLQSPTVGGLSWLAHGTALSGLWIDSQLRYDSLMLSERPTLNRLFQRAGWRTVAVMPAISMAWPESQYFGYDQIYGAHDMDYQGAPFNWVTMPDQYVMAAFERLERTTGKRAPVMAEIALISSHAPWTPTPTLLDWDAIGDGSVFTAQAIAGPSPEEVWQEPARIREQYRKSIEYAMSNLVSYAERHGDDDLVMLILGDHQAAPLVTGGSDSRDVPVHLIARDPAVIAAVEEWGWSEGLVPAATQVPWRMDEVRDRFIQAFSAEPPIGAGGSDGLSAP